MSPKLKLHMVSIMSPRLDCTEKKRSRSIDIAEERVPEDGIKSSELRRIEVEVLVGVVADGKVSGLSIDHEGRNVDDRQIKGVNRVCNAATERMISAEIQQSRQNTIPQGECQVRCGRARYEPLWK